MQQLKCTRLGIDVLTLKQQPINHEQKTLTWRRLRGHAAIKVWTRLGIDLWHTNSSLYNNKRKTGFDINIRLRCHATISCIWSRMPGNRRLTQRTAYTILNGKQWFWHQRNAPIVPRNKTSRHHEPIIVIQIRVLRSATCNTLSMKKMIDVLASEASL